MSIKSNITDKSTNISAEVVDGTGEKKALVVATRPLKTFENSVEFFTNPTYGSDMNQNAAFGGTPEKVHDGIDSVLWTGSQIVGTTVTFDDTGQNHTAAGTKSILFDRPGATNTIQIAKGSNLDLSGYTALTLWVYVDNNWTTDSFSIYGYDTGTVSVIGTPVNLQDYFNQGNNDVWQKISIPLEDMDLTTETIDAIRITCISTTGVKPTFYLDDIQFEETGDPLSFSLEAEKGTWLHVEEFTISIADAYAGTVETGSDTLFPTMPSIPYDDFLGVTLTSGVNYRRIQDGETKFSQTILKFIDLIELAGTEIIGSGSDGTNTWLSIRAKHIEPIVLKPENDDILSFTISEDLSGLLRFRISAGCKIENRTLTEGEE